MSRRDYVSKSPKGSLFTGCYQVITSLLYRVDLDCLNSVCYDAMAQTIRVAKRWLPWRPGSARKVRGSRLQGCRLPAAGLLQIVTCRDGVVRTHDGDLACFCLCLVSAMREFNFSCRSPTILAIPQAVSKPASSLVFLVRSMLIPS